MVRIFLNSNGVTMLIPGAREKGDAVRTEN